MISIGPIALIGAILALLGVNIAALWLVIDQTRRRRLQARRPAPPPASRPAVPQTACVGCGAAIDLFSGYYCEPCRQRLYLSVEPGSRPCAHCGTACNAVYCDTCRDRLIASLTTPADADAPGALEAGEEEQIRKLLRQAGI